VISIYRTNPSGYFARYIHKTELPDYKIAQASCDGTEASLADCKLSLVPSKKCDAAIGIRCASGIL
jgi:hypothetical protein